MADKRKRTPWFTGRVKPVRPGVYQRNFGYAVKFARWDGKRWFMSQYTPREAEEDTWPSGYSSLPWRGLATKPKGTR